MNLKDITEPKLIEGNLAVDDRGTLSFVNNFFLDGFKRFYIIENHQLNYIRAFHGHLKEWKAFISLKGSFIIGYSTFAIDEYNEVDVTCCDGINRVILSDKKPSIFILPGGYLNGTMNLTPDAKLMVFSSSTLEESKNDDYRLPYGDCDIETDFELLDLFSILER